MFRVFMFYTGRFTGSGSAAPTGLVQMVDALQRLTYFAG